MIKFNHLFMRFIMSLIRKNLSLHIIIAFAPTLYAASDNEIPNVGYVSINEVLKHAAYDSPDMIAAQLDIAEKNADRLRSWKTHLPEVSANYRIGGFHEVRKSIDSSNATRYGAAYGITATHPLYHWGAVGALRAQGFAQEAISKKQSVVNFMMLVDQLRRAYNNLIVTKFELYVKGKQVDFKRTEVDERNILFEKGITSKNLRDELQLERQAIELTYEYEKNNLDTALVKFKNNSGYLDLTIEQVPLIIELPDINIEELKKWYQNFVESGFDTSLPAQLAQDHLKAIDNGLTINKARQKPTLNFQGGMTQQPYEINNSYELQTIFFLGFGGSWNLFDRAESSNNKRSLMLRKRQVSATLARTRAELYAVGQNALNMLSTSMKSIELRKRQIALAEKIFELEKINFKNGTSNNEMLHEANTRLLKAEEGMLLERANVANAYHAFLGIIFRDPVIDYFNPDVQK